MKKLLILLTLCATLPALATTLCAEDDVVAIVLDTEIGGGKSVSNTSLFEWGVEFPYGSVWGTATCIDTPGTLNAATEELRSVGDGEPATGGERKGRYCWCRMTHPAVSRWVLYNLYNSVDACGSSCAFNCGYYLPIRIELRAAMFTSLPQ